MDFPFTFESDSQVRSFSWPSFDRRLWLVLVLPVLAVGVFLQRHRHTGAPVHPGTVMVSATPTGAGVSVDGKSRGPAPQQLSLAAGTHRIELRRSGYLTDSFAIDVRPDATLDLNRELWPERPHATLLRPPLPGTAVAGATFLADGRLALAVAVSAEERQLWAYAGDSDSYQRLGPSGASAVAGSAAGRTVAYMKRNQAFGVESGPAWTVRAIDSAGSDRQVYQAGSGDGQAVDLTLSPDGRRIVLAERSSLGSSSRTKLVLFDAGREAPQPFTELPAELVPGSYVWAPDGSRVAFAVTTPTGQSLCLMSTDGRFRYLGEVASVGSTIAPLPVAWSRSDQLAFERQGAPGGGIGPFGVSSSPQVALTEAAEGSVQVRGSGVPAGWLDDGSLLILHRPKRDGQLELSQLTNDGATRTLAQLPVKGGNYAGEWDGQRRRLIVGASRDATLGGSGTDFYLVDLSGGEVS